MSNSSTILQCKSVINVNEKKQTLSNAVVEEIKLSFDPNPDNPNQRYVTFLINNKLL